MVGLWHVRGVKFAIYFIIFGAGGLFCDTAFSHSIGDEGSSSGLTDDWSMHLSLFLAPFFLIAQHHRP